MTQPRPTLTGRQLKGAIAVVVAMAFIILLGVLFGDKDKAVAAVPAPTVTVTQTTTETTTKTVTPSPSATEDDYAAQTTRSTTNLKIALGAAWKAQKPAGRASICIAFAGDQDKVVDYMFDKMTDGPAADVLYKGMSSGQIKYAIAKFFEDNCGLAGA